MRAAITTRFGLRRRSVSRESVPKRAQACSEAALETTIRNGRNGHVAGKGRVRVFRNVEFLKAPAALPARPVVLLVNGTDSRRTLQAALKARFQIAYFTSNADSYRLTGDPKRKINAVVVDLSKAPASQSQRLGLIRNLRYLFPSLRIVVATNSAKLRVQVVRAGANTTIPAPATAKAVGSALAPLFRWA